MQGSFPAVRAETPRNPVHKGANRTALPLVLVRGMVAVERVGVWRLGPQGLLAFPAAFLARPNPLHLRRRTFPLALISAYALVDLLGGVVDSEHLEQCLSGRYF